MRTISALFVCTALTSLAGCGSKPAAPAEVTADEERRIKEDQKNVDAEEQKQATQRKTEGSAPEEQVEAQERGRQRR